MTNEETKSHALAMLKMDIGKGDTIYAMRAPHNARIISLLYIDVRKIGRVSRPYLRDITPTVARALGMRMTRKGWISVGGAQFNPCDHVVSNLSMTLFGEDRAIRCEEMS